MPEIDKRRNLMVEAWFEREDVAYRFEPDFPMDEVDRDASSRIQDSVLNALDARVVDEFTTSHEAGALFPAGWGWIEPSHNRLILGAGNHRDGMYQRVGESTFPVYIITGVSQKRFEALAVTANMLEADRRPSDDATRLLIAHKLVEECGYTIEAAARETHVSQAKIGRRRDAGRMRERAAKLGIKPLPADSPVEILSTLGRISSDPVFTEAVKAVREGKLRVQVVEDLYGRIKAVRSDGDTVGIRVIEDYRQEFPHLFGKKQPQSTPDQNTGLAPNANKKHAIVKRLVREGAFKPQDLTGAPSQVVKEVIGNLEKAQRAVATGLRNARQVAAR